MPFATASDSQVGILEQSKTFDLTRPTSSPKPRKLSNLNKDMSPSSGAGCCTKVTNAFSWCAQRHDFVSVFIATVFGKYGVIISRFPRVFLICSIALAIFLSAGMFRITIVSLDLADFTPEDSQSSRDKVVVEKFEAISAAGTLDTSSQDKSKFCRYSELLFTSKSDQDSIFTESNFKLIRRFEQLIWNITTKLTNGTVVKYTDLCLRLGDGNCLGMSLVNLYKQFPAELLFMDGFGLTYPYYHGHYVGLVLGGVRVDDEMRIQFAKVFREIYVPCFPHGEDAAADEWEEQFRTVLIESNHADTLPFSMAWHSNALTEKTMMQQAFSLMPLFVVTLLAVGAFSVASSLWTDCVASKPLLGVIGILSTAAAIVSAFGLMGWLNEPFVTLALATPFLALAIGLDDMHVLLSGWRRTDHTLSVEDRMQETLREAGTSIFITFLTNVVAFIIGSYMPYPAIQKLSKFTTAAMCLDFLFQLTLFTSCLALSGYAEKRQSHSCLPCINVDKVFDPESDSLIRGIMCRRQSDVNMTDSGIVRFLQGSYSNAIFSLPGRILVLLVYLGYLALIGYGFNNLSVGFHVGNFFPKSSESFVWYQVLESNFREYWPRMPFIIDGELDYHDPKVRISLDNTISKLEDSSFFWGKNITRFWLRDFHEWAHVNGTFIDDKFAFYSVLDEWLNTPPNDMFISDVVFEDKSDEDFVMLEPQRIVMTRAWMVGRQTAGPIREAGLLTTIREIVGSSPLNEIARLVVYAADFTIYEQHVSIMQNTIYNILVALGAVLLASTFMAPYVVAMFWLAICLMSIVAGLLGCMHFWNIDLDSVSIVNVVIGIGFSTDFVSHYTYGYLIAAGSTSVEKARRALGDVGSATFPTALGTILAVLAMSTSPAYVYKVFFKMIFLTVCLCALHSLLFLPVIMSLVGPVQTGHNSTSSDSASKDREARNKIERVETNTTEITSLDATRPNGQTLLTSFGFTAQAKFESNQKSKRPHSSSSMMVHLDEGLSRTEKVNQYLSSHKNKTQSFGI